MFVDQARVRVVAGAGGNGCTSFRREKYVPLGGPDGGDGGDGGSVYFVADRAKGSLLDLKYHSVWKGNRGVHGQGSDKHGKRGEDIEIQVPPGTLVRNFQSGETMADLADAGARFLAAKGGKGGRGNARFTSATHRAPKFAELGEPGQTAEYILELKLIAEVGIVGLPNAGKSTLLSRISAAQPKIGDYPFTTLSPNLGVAQLSDHRTMTVADIPGIIEGAAEGKGLGLDFLRHIERTKVLLFLIDASDEDPNHTVEILEHELDEYSGVFEGRPRVYAFNKADIPAARERFEAIRGQFHEPFLISAATGEGIGPLLEQLWSIVDRMRREEAEAVLVAPEEESTYSYEAPFTIERTRNGFRVEGKKITRAMQMTDFSNEAAVRHMHHKLEKMGLFKALKRMGAEEGAAIIIGDVELEYRP